MDFFERQNRARKNTLKLVGMFALGILAVVVALCAVAVVVLWYAEAGRPVVDTLVNSRENPATFYHPSSLTELEQKLKKTQPGDNKLINIFLWYWPVLGGVALGVAVLILLGSLYKWYQLSGGGLAVAEMLGGRVLNPATTNQRERVLMNVVEEMSIASGVPVPVVCVLDEEDAINAFAAGLTPENSVIGVTRGCLEKLSRDELQGVIAHEYSHILNMDSALNIRLIAMLHGLMVLVMTGYVLLRVMPRTINTRSRNKNAGGFIIVMLVGAVALILIGSIGVLVGKLIQSAVSRQREFLADASAVQFTRNPRGLIGAFLKIQNDSVRPALNSAAGVEVAHMMFAGLGGLMATHPPLMTRILAIDPNFTPENYRLSAPSPRDLPTQNQPATGGSFGGRAMGSAMGFAGEASAGPAAARIKPKRLMSTVGGPDPRHLPAAQGLVGSIPPELIEAAHEPFTARCVVVSLLLSRATEQERAGQARVLSAKADKATLQTIQQLLPVASQLSSYQHMPTVQLCSQALAMLSVHQQADFVSLLDDLAGADNQMTLEEYCLLRLVRDMTTRTPSLAVRYSAVSGLGNEIGLLLGALAKAGGSEESHLRDALTELGLTGKADTLIQAGAEVTVRTLDQAIGKLVEAGPAVKRRVIAAAAELVLADRLVTAQETELLRVFAAALRVPLPPVLPELTV